MSSVPCRSSMRFWYGSAFPITTRQSATQGSRLSTTLDSADRIWLGRGCRPLCELACRFWMWVSADVGCPRGWTGDGIGSNHDLWIDLRAPTLTSPAKIDAVSAHGL